MGKINGMYRSFCQDRNAECREIMTGGNEMENLQDFLKKKLNAEDYFTAEEMLNVLLTKTEEKGFEAGAKYTAGLGVELVSK